MWRLVANVRQIASSDFAAQARTGFAAAGQGITSGAKNAAEGFNKFIEGQDEKAASAAGRSKAEPERKDFWDSFGAGGNGGDDASPKKSGSLGTSAMKKPQGASGQKKKDDGWGDDW